MNRAPACLILALGFLAPFAAVAGPEDKSTARELFSAAMAAEDAGDCEKVIELLTKAEAIFHAPTHLQHLARCYEKKGKFVMAAETYRQLTTETLPENASQPFRDAVKEAQTQLPFIEKKLAHLTLHITPAGPWKVKVDDAEWATATIDVAHVIDPGEHTITVHAEGYLPASKSVTLDESESREETVSLVVAPVAKTTENQPSGGAFPLRTLGWVAVGAGGASLLAATFTGVASQVYYNSLQQDCRVPSQCTAPDLASRKSTISTLSTATNVLWITGAVLVGGGALTVLLAPTGPKTTSGITFSIVGRF